MATPNKNANKSNTNTNKKVVLDRDFQDVSRQFAYDFQNSPMGFQMLKNSVKADVGPDYENDFNRLRYAREEGIFHTPIRYYDYNKPKYATAFKSAGWAPNEFSTIGGWSSKLPSITQKIGPYLNARLSQYGLIEPDIHIHNNASADLIRGHTDHELSHAQDWNGALIPYSDINKMNRYAGDKSTFSPHQKYISEPTETRARLNDFRRKAKEQGIYDPFTQKLNIEQLRKYDTKPGRGFDPIMQLRKVYTDEQIVDMANTIAKKNAMPQQDGMMYALNGAGDNNIDNIFNKPNIGIDVSALQKGVNPWGTLPQTGVSQFSNMADVTPGVFNMDDNQLQGRPIASPNEAPQEDSEKKIPWQKLIRQGIDITTGIANMVNSSKANEKEKMAFRESLQPGQYDNPQRFGANDNQMYFKNGGDGTPLEYGRDTQGRPGVLAYTAQVQPMQRDEYGNMRRPSSYNRQLTSAITPMVPTFDRIKTVEVPGGHVNPNFEGYGVSNKPTSDWQNIEGMWSRPGMPMQPYYDRSQRMQSLGSARLPNIENPNTNIQGSLYDFSQSNAMPQNIMEYGSIVDMLKAKGQDSSFAARKRLAEQYGIKNYTGSASQNQQLIAFNSQKRNGGDADEENKFGLSTQMAKDNMPQQPRQFASDNEMRQNLFSQHQVQPSYFNADPNMNIPGRVALSQEMADAYARKQMLLKGLGYADVATDIMQLGNFIPIPQIAAIGMAGNVIGGGIDAFQMGMDLRNGDYRNAGINALSAIAPIGLEANGYRRAIANTTPNTFANKVASLSKNQGGHYRHLTSYPHLANNPVTNRGIGFNRSILGFMGGETIYDSFQKRNGGNIHKFDVGGFTFEENPDEKLKASNANDFLITPEEYYLYTKRLQDCKEGRGCLEQAFNYYDNYVAPNLKLPSSWQIKESAGISSGDNNSRFKEYGKSADSWDIHGLLQDKGAKKILAASLNNTADIETMLRKMSPDQQAQYFRNLKMPLGSIIGMGDKGGSGGIYGTTVYNSTKGLPNSNHSAMVVGYDETGLPMLYDYGNIVPITNRTFGILPITNITSPKEVSQYTYDYLKANNLLENNYYPLDIQTNTNGYDEDEYIPFIDALTTNKKKFGSAFNLKNNEYDELARKAAALALTESAGGDDLSIRWKGPGGLIPVPSYVTDKMGIGETTGITQINSDMLFSNNSISRNLKMLDITKDNYNPWDSRHIAAATMALLQSNQGPQKANYAKNVAKLGYDPKLSDPAITYYQWNQPKLLRTGQALGDSERVKNYMSNYNKVNIKPRKQNGGIMIKHENRGNFTAWNKRNGGDCPMCDLADAFTPRYAMGGEGENDWRKGYDVSSPSYQVNLQAARTVDKGEPFIFPDGTTKTWNQMNWKEKGYVSGLAVDTRFRVGNPDVGLQFMEDVINPFALIGSAAGSLGTSFYEADKTNSVTPVVTGVLGPLLGGAAASTRTMNPVTWMRHGPTVNNAQMAVDFMKPAGYTTLRNLGNTFMKKANGGLTREERIAQRNDNIARRSAEFWEGADPSEYEQVAGFLGDVIPEQPMQAIEPMGGFQMPMIQQEQFQPAMPHPLTQAQWFAPMSAPESMYINLNEEAPSASDEILQAVTDNQYRRMPKVFSPVQNPTNTTENTENEEPSYELTTTDMVGAAAMLGIIIYAGYDMVKKGRVNPKTMQRLKKSAAPLMKKLGNSTMYKGLKDKADDLFQWVGSKNAKSTIKPTLSQTPAAIVTPHVPSANTVNATPVTNFTPATIKNPASVLGPKPKPSYTAPKNSKFAPKWKSPPPRVFRGKKYEAGGEVDQVQGLPFGHPAANAIVESGEAIQFGNGQMARVADQGPYIEDHGDTHDGTYLPDVQRVLEDTSAKAGRNKKSDKLLAMNGSELNEIFGGMGLNFKGKYSHAGAFDKVTNAVEGERKKYMDKNNRLAGMSNLSEAQRRAMELNQTFAAMLPEKEDIFEMLFQHQEAVKQQHGISDSGKQDQLPQARIGINMDGDEDNTYGTSRFKGGLYPNSISASGLGLNNALVRQSRNQNLGSSFGTNFNAGDSQSFNASNQSGTQFSPEQFVQMANNAMANRPMQNKEPLQWYDTLGPTANLINSLSRYPEQSYEVDLPRMQNPFKVNPQTQLNEVTAGLRPAMRDTLNPVVRAQLMANADQARSGILANTENVNNQLMNTWAQGNNAIAVQEAMTNTQLAQDFGERWKKDKSMADQFGVAAIDEYAQPFAKNRAFNRTLNMLDTPNMTYDPTTGKIIFDRNSRASMITGNLSEMGIYGDNKSKRGYRPSASELQELKRVDPVAYQQYIRSLSGR
jgi:hypothetical protein